MIDIDQLTIDPEFASICRALSPDEEKRLRESLVENGCHSPVIVWRGHNIVVDGMNRVRLCREAGMAFPAREMAFTGRPDAIAWIINNQLARRNLTGEEKKYLIGRKYGNEKKRQGGDRKSEEAKSNAQSELLNSTTADKIAKAEGVSRETVKRAEVFSQAVDAAAAKAPEVKPALLSGVVPQKDVPALAEAPAKALKELAAMPPAQQRKAAKAIVEKQATPDEAKAAAEEVLDHNKRSVPGHLRLIFGEVLAQLKAACRSVASILKLTDTLSADPKAGAFLERTSLVNDLTNAKQALKFAQPYAVCPYCKGTGTGCKPCKATGWVNETVYRNAPADLRE